MERLLGDDLAALVVDTPNDAARLAGVAGRRGSTNGRATIVSLGMRSVSDINEAPGERLLDRLGCKPEAQGMLEALLGDIRIVKDATEAEKTMAQMIASSYDISDIQYTDPIVEYLQGGK